MKNKWNAVLIVLALLLLSVAGVGAQDEELTLKLSRDFGYSSGTGDIQGLFSMKVTGPENLARVEFYIDETMIGEVLVAPFRIQFTTDDYPLGIHTMYAIGFTEIGEELRSRVLSGNFVTAEASWDTAGKIVVPMIAVMLVAILMAVVLPAIRMRGKTEMLPMGEERQYGIKGGCVCPNCKRPFVMHFWGLNLGLSRFDRCPYCGKWSLVRHSSLAVLRQAEKDELTWGKAEVPAASAEDGLRKDIDDSKFQSL